MESVTLAAEGRAAGSRSPQNAPGLTAATLQARMEESPTPTCIFRLPLSPISHRAHDLTVDR